MEDNKYRGVVRQALIKQSLSNFMMANHKAPFNDSLFRFVVTARNQALMTRLCQEYYSEQGMEFVGYAIEIDKILHIICSTHAAK
jgi:hypothetical protein